MKIEKINISKIANYNGQKTDNNATEPKYGLKMASPLKHDCVTFGTKRGKQAIRLLTEALRIAEEKAAELAEEANLVTVKELPSEQKRWKINKKDAERIHKSIKKPQAIIKAFIHNLFDDLLYSEKSAKNPILEIHDRPKSVDSIIEKTATLKIKSIEEVYEKITDLNGVKIEMRKKAGKDDVDFVLDRLIPLIKTGQFELPEIEVKLPAAIKSLSPKEQDAYMYASSSMLKRLVEVQENFWNTKNTAQENIRKVDLKKQYTPGNYCAIHMLGYLPNKNARIFEIQLMGAYVGLGKELDDILFKILDGKEPDKIYTPIIELIQKLKEEDPEAFERFKQYKKDALLGLREREIQEAKNNKATSKNAPLFISAKKYNLEAKYDLNNMMELKKECEAEAATAKKKAEAQKKKTKTEIKTPEENQRHSLISMDTLNKLVEKFNSKREKLRHKNK